MGAAPISVRLNGKEAQVAAGLTLLGLLRERGVDPARVVVAVNGEIVAREQWGSLVPSAGDRLEVVHVVAGGEDPMAEDALVIAGVRLSSRLFCGTGKFVSAEVMAQALAAAESQLVTVAVRYFDLDLGGSSLLQELDPSRYRLLPNTAGAYTAEDALHMAELARAATGTNWIKLEVIGDRETLWPDVAATVTATRELVRRGFVVLPYTSPDPVVARHLEEAGAATVMPLGSPIGSGQGVLDLASIRRVVRAVSVPVVVDAGVGSPADAAQAMEAGASAVLVNTAIAKAADPVRMAQAMALGVRAGRLGFLAGRIARREDAQASTSSVGVPRVE